MTPSRWILGCTVLATLGLAVLSALQVQTRLVGEAPFRGAPGLDSDWSPPQTQGDWIASAGIPPPAASATRDELEDWLEHHYPVLAVELARPSRHPAPQNRLDLGGGPPRDLSVEPGVGLVLREP